MRKWLKKRLFKARKKMLRRRRIKKREGTYSGVKKIHKAIYSIDRDGASVQGISEEELAKRARAKISPIHITQEMAAGREMDEKLKKFMIREADQYEMQLEEDPMLCQIQVPDHMFDNIIHMIEEYESGNSGNEILSAAENKQKAILYVALTDEDRKALEIGRKICGLEYTIEEIEEMLDAIAKKKNPV